jgi:hypothetical protein
MRIRRLIATCLAVAALGAACSTGGLQAPPPAGGGEITGILYSQHSDGSHRGTVSGAHVGAYLKSFPPGGPMLRNAPRPVATAVTAANGTFALHLRPGRYYVALVGQGHAAAGKWAAVTSGHGATVVLVSCTDCPIPL